MGQKTLVIGNWKMKPSSVVEAAKLFRAIKKRASKYRNVQMIVCPPFIYLAELKKLLSGKSVLLGAQDVFWSREGPYTGEVSVSMLVNEGVSHVIVGHSERRALGETNEDVAKKVQIVLSEKLIVILCVGERERDGNGEYLDYVRREILSALEGVSKHDLSRLIIAYEPIWAIGKRGEEALTPDDLHQMVLFIRKILVEKYNRELALSVPILYGGSVEEENSEALLSHGETNGFLVGRASLDFEEFEGIIRHANQKSYGAF